MEDDLKQSVGLLSQSFRSWHRLQDGGVVRALQLTQVLSDDDWQQHYPSRFILMHKGSHEPNSQRIGSGQYSKIYQKNNHAYKISRIGLDRSVDEIVLLRLALKELAFFHTMQHPRIMRPDESQIVMAHGTIKTVIHRMFRARFSLMDAIAKKEMTCFQDLIHVFHQIARGLQYMHHHGIVHGDIKPANILITSDYQAFLTDFTITSFENRGTTFAFGTLWWRAPECVLARDSTRESDVWAFGVMLLDSLYQCIYMQDIAGATDGQSAWLALLTLLGDPPVTFINRFVDEEHRRDLFQRRPAIRNPQCRLHLTLPEWTALMDLIRHIMLWEPGQRLTMDQVLNHVVFRGAQAGPIVEALTEVLWRTRSEKEQLCNLTRLQCRELLGYSLNDDWALGEIVLLAKRLMDKLRHINATFHLDAVIHMSCQMVLFFWCDYWPPRDTLFESQLFHIFHLLENRVFSFTVKEQEWKAKEHGWTAERGSLLITGF